MNRAAALAREPEFNTDEAFRRIRSVFELFSRECLFIRPKGEAIGERLPPELEEVRRGKGALVPLVLNRAQRHLHRVAERQRARQGYVRILGLKGRQQGFSTYVGGRFYWRGSGEFGKSAFILTHEDKATRNLWQMVERYHRHCPEDFRPRKGPAKGFAMVFDRLDTTYQVGTAGSKETGRSGTVHYFHGSEVAFWADAASHMAAVGQTVPLAPGTEVFLESTANGVGNVFHELWQSTAAGEGDFEAVFVPWFWQVEYQRPCPAHIEFDVEELELGEVYGLSREQLYWRRQKIASDFRGDAGLFRQEYPCTPTEAFLAGSTKSFIQPLIVVRAQAERHVEPWGPKVMGVDVAEYGDDDSAISRRQGPIVKPTIYCTGISVMELAGRAAHEAAKWEREDGVPVHTIYVDQTGLGAGVRARLQEMSSVSAHVVGVDNGSVPDDPAQYVKKIDEMYGRMLEWLTDDNPLLPDDPRLAGELTSRWYGYDSSRRLRVETKEKMKDRGLKSPDGAESLALTFAYPIAADFVPGSQSSTVEIPRSSWKF